MIRLRSVGVLSCAKIFAVLQAAIGVLIGFFFLLFGVVGAAIVPGQQKLGMIGIIIVAVLMPLFYGLLGFVMGAVWAFVYNLAAQSIGGLELEFESLPAAVFARRRMPLGHESLASNSSASLIALVSRARIARLPTASYS